MLFSFSENAKFIRGVNFRTFKVGARFKVDAAWLLDKLCHCVVQIFTNFVQF